MKKTILLCLLMSSEVFAAGFSKAQDFHAATQQELAMQSLPSAPGMPAAVLDWIRDDDDNYSSSTEYLRIKIFTDAGKHYGDVEIPYSPGYPVLGSISDISARTIRPDGTFVPFDGKVYDKVLVKGGGRIWRAKTFTFPEVQPGSILEYRYMRRWADNVLFDTLWKLQRDLPIAHSKLTLRPYARKLTSEFSTFFVFAGIPPGKKIEKKGEAYELDLDQMPPLPHEEFAPPEEVMTAYVKFYYTRGTTAPALFWKAETATQRKKIEGFIGNPGTARAMAQQLAAGSKDPMETLKKIYAAVQAMRNYSFEAQKSDQELRRQDIGESRGAEEVLRNKAGFGEELNRAFVAVARAAGFQADVVRVAPRDIMIFSLEVPDAEQVRAEVAVVTMEGKPLYLDPGTPHAPFGIVSWEKTTVPGFRVTKNDVQWVEVPQSLPADALMRRTAVLTLNGETLEGTIAVAFSGQEALVRRLRNFGEDDVAQKKALEDEVRGWFANGATVKATKVTGFTSSDDPLAATFEVSLPIASRAGSRVIVPLSVFASASKNPFAPTTRINPIYFPYPSMVEDEVRLTIPSGFSLGPAPQPAKLNAGSFQYTNEVKRDGSEVRFRRTVSMDAMFIEQEYYNALRNFFSAVTTADQQPIVLTASAP